MIKVLTVIIISILACSSYGQLPNNNILLLKNLNEHSSPSFLYSAIWGYKAPNGREYALLGCYNGTSIVDITDSTNIREVDFIPGPESNVREMKVYLNYAYITTDVSEQSAGLQIVDLQYLPDSAMFVSNWNFAAPGKVHTISQSGPYLYLNGGDVTLNGGTTIVDITDPVNPIKRGSWTDKYVHDGRIRNDTMFACNIFSNDGGTITVINVSNKDNPQTISSWINAPNPGPHNIDLTTDRRHALVTEEINGIPRLLKIWNIQNLSNVVQTGTWQPTGITSSIIHNIEIYGNTAIIAHYSAGVRVVNISNPSFPIETAWYDTYPANNNFTFDGCWGVFMLPSGKIIASDRQTGLYVLKKTVPATGVAGDETAPGYSLGQNYPNPFNPSTTINFSLARNSKVSLEVFDITGKKAAELVNDRRDAGIYEIKFDATEYGLTSGIYFYKIVVSSIEGSFHQTKKMLIVK